MSNPNFDIECVVAANIITPEEIANAPIYFVDEDGTETLLKPGENI